MPMEFRLVYSGRVLGASRNNSRADVKHAIRREFHPQLRRLWQTKEPLRDIVKKTGFDEYLKEKEKDDPDYMTKNIGTPNYISFDEGDALYREFGAEFIGN